MATPDHILDAIRALPVAEQLRLVGRVIEGLQAASLAGAEEPSGGEELIGLWEGEADVAEEMIAEVMRGRESRVLRVERG